MSLLIATAFQPEYQLLWEMAKDRRSVKSDPSVALFSGKLFGLDVDVLLSEMGPKKCRAALEIVEAKKNPKASLMIGFCGGLSSLSKVGAVLIPDRVVDLETEQFFSPSVEVRQTVAQKIYHKDLDFLVGDLITSEKIIKKLEEKKYLNRMKGAVAVDMEAYVFGEFFELKKKPWFVVKSVMDDLSTTTYSKNSLKSGIEAATQSLTKVLPSVIEALAATWKL
jgi:nucleoside phosphorylase